MLRIALIVVALLVSTPALAAASLSSLTVKQLEKRIEANTERCIIKNIESACQDHAPMRELWRRGYCSKDAQGHIGRCTASEIADDRRFTESH